MWFSLNNNFVPTTININLQQILFTMIQSDLTIPSVQIQLKQTVRLRECVSSEKIGSLISGSQYSNKEFVTALNYLQQNNFDCFEIISQFAKNLQKLQIDLKKEDQKVLFEQIKVILAQGDPAYKQFLQSQMSGAKAPNFNSF